MPTLPFLPNFLWTFVRMDPVNIRAKFEVRSFTRDVNLQSVALAVPEIIAIAVLGSVANPNLGEWEAVGGRGWYRSKERL